MHQEDKAVEPGRMACLVTYDAMIDRIGRPVILLTGYSIIGMAYRAGGIVDQPEVDLPRPGCNGIVIPFVRRKEISCRQCRNSKVLNLLVILSQVGDELLFGDKQAIPLCPITIQQVFIAVWPEVTT